MISQKITEISVTPISAYFPHEIGRNARNTGHGISGIEWLVRAKTEGGIEGLTIANAFLSNLGGNSVEELMKLHKRPVGNFRWQGGQTKTKTRTGLQTEWLDEHPCL